MDLKGPNILHGRRSFFAVGTIGVIAVGAIIP